MYKCTCIHVREHMIHIRRCRIDINIHIYYMMIIIIMGISITNHGLDSDVHTLILITACYYSSLVLIPVRASVVS